MSSTVETDESKPGNSAHLPQLDPPSTNISSVLDLTDAIKIQEPAWAKLRSSLCDLRDSSGEFAELASATRLLLEYFDGIEKAASKQEDHISLAEELNTTVGVLVQYIKTPISSTDDIFNITTRIKQQAEEIKKMINRGAIRRLVVVNKDKDTIDSYRKVLSLFQRLQEILNSIINDHLRALNPVHYAAYDSMLSMELLRRACTEGTCSEVLSNLEKWQYDPNGPAVYWINGMLGTGKTTIACTLSESLERRKQLAASFFCTRNNADCGTVTRIIPTIAYQLARNFAPFDLSLRGALADEPELDSLTIAEHFERLLRDPLQEAKHIIPGNLVIVIDDLHECEDLDGVETLLYLLLRYVNELHIKFVVTSRPVLEIYRFMRQYVYDEPAPQVIQHEMDPFSAKADIKLYLREELSFMSPTDSQIEQLAQGANYLFLNAARLVRYILGKRSVHRRRRLQKLLLWISESTEEPYKMDVLYSQIIELALEKTQMEDNETNDVMIVLRTVLLAQKPISVETIAALTGLEDSLRVRFALQPLQNLLVRLEGTTLVLIRDPSFSNFLLSPERSGQYSFDVAEHSCLLAEGCFKVMKRQLQFNICELVSSFVPDKQVNDIQERIEQKISATLAYACCFWADHFVNSTIDNVTAILDKFLNNHLLFWAEVLNLRQELSIGVAALLKAKKQLELLGYTSSRELIALLDDALSFVQQFTASSSVQPTLYLYAFLIDLCPRSSRVHKVYSKYIQGWFERGNHGRIAEHVSVANLDVLNSSVGSGVLSVTYSPDGAQVVIGCEDGTISIHSAHDGSLLTGPLVGHTDWVRCVAFSPEGTRIISASSDCTIRMWDAISGAPITASFKGHDHPVKSVSFSADGRRIASGSWDNTIRIWNAEDGMLVMEPFEGHKWGVNCVTFSLDSKLVGSGSNDHTVRIWNISYETLVPATTEFNGHTGSVMCVAFTPNSKKLISGSVDCTICVWDIFSGSLLTRLVQACNHLVYAVAVSPDGLYVASGSADSTINVWDIDDGRLAAGPLVGHSSGVRALAFSPDGTRIVSGSQDKTLRIWDVCEGRHAIPNSIQRIPSDLAVKVSGASNYDHISVTLGSPIFQKHTIRVWTLNRKELDLFSFHSPTQASITSFAWPLVCPHTIANLHSYNNNRKPISGLPDDDSVRNHRKEQIPSRWIIGTKFESLFWGPPPCGLANYLDHMTSMISNSESKARFWLSHYEPNSNDRPPGWDRTEAEA